MSGNRKYLLKYTKEVLQKDLPKLTKSVKALIKKTIEEKLVIDPITYGKPLRYSLKGYRSIRVGNYRIIYIFQPEKNRIIISAIKHRKDAYN